MQDHHESEEWSIGVDDVWSEWQDAWVEPGFVLDEDDVDIDEEKWSWKKTHAYRLTLTLRRVGGLGESVVF